MLLGKRKNENKTDKNVRKMNHPCWSKSSSFVFFLFRPTSRVVRIFCRLFTHWSLWFLFNIWVFSQLLKVLNVSISEWHTFWNNTHSLCLSTTSPHFQFYYHCRTATVSLKDPIGKLEIFENFTRAFGPIIALVSMIICQILAVCLAEQLRNSVAEKKPSKYATRLSFSWFSIACENPSDVSWQWWKISEKRKKK